MFSSLARIGVSEFILVFLLFVALFGVFALSSNVNFQQTILPPPPPDITTILGDANSRAVLIIGKTALANARVRVFAFSDPLVIETKADGDGVFYAAFTEDILPPGPHQFTAITVLGEERSTDPSPRLAVVISDEYTVTVADKQGAGVIVKIGSVDAATSELLRSIIRNQEAARQVMPEAVPKKNMNSGRALIVQIVLLVVVIVESVFLLLARARRKALEGRSFLHLGHGLYRLPTKNQ
ncbi:MAG: hypothetical protein HY566_01025 [Candidatus Kerfeldbacteria bacterium]|nr:hypothetical protein [Candidatus Kerfeldbacteria bacterium]